MIRIGPRGSIAVYEIEVMESGFDEQWSSSAASVISSRFNADSAAQSFSRFADSLDQSGRSQPSISRE